MTSCAAEEDEAVGVLLTKIRRETFDPHRLVGTRFRNSGPPMGSVYCNVSRRTEGTVRMEGRVCSYCGWRIGGSS